MIKLFRRLSAAHGIVRDGKRIADAIKNAEAHTSGEVRVVILGNYQEDNLAAKAEEMFHWLGMKSTQDQTGVLIMLVIKRRQFVIWADEGIYARVPQTTWDTLALKMSKHFQAGDFEKGLIQTVGEVGVLLSQHFPRGDADINELPDEVVFREE